MRTQAVADWPGILNASQDIIKAHVDDNGNGVFSFISLFEGTQYQRQAPTICRYLQDLGILVRGRRTAEGAFNWTLKSRKVNVGDVRKARAKRSTTTDDKAARMKSKTRNAKATKIKAPSATSSSHIPVGSKELKKIIPLGESLPMLVEVVESLRKENNDLKAQLKELKEHNLSDEIAERVSRLISELTEPIKS